MESHDVGEIKIKDRGLGYEKKIEDVNRADSVDEDRLFMEKSESLRKKFSNPKFVRVEVKHTQQKAPSIADDNFFTESQQKNCPEEIKLKKE